MPPPGHQDAGVVTADTGVAQQGRGGQQRVAAGEPGIVVQIPAVHHSVTVHDQGGVAREGVVVPADRRTLVPGDARQRDQPAPPLARRDDHRGDVAQPGVAEHSGGRIRFGHRERGAPGVRDGGVQVPHHDVRRPVRRRTERGHGGTCGGGGERPVAQPVGDQHLPPAADLTHRVPVAARLLAGDRPGQPARPVRLRRCGVPDLDDQDRAPPRRRVAVEPARLPGDRAEPDAERAGGGVAVGGGEREVGHAGAGVDRDQLHAGPPAPACRTHQERALAGVLDQVAGDLGGDDGQVRDARRAQFELPAETLGRPAYAAGGRAGVDPEPDAVVGHHVGDHRDHLVTVIRVPSPTAVRMSKSSTSRRAPLSPRPSPPPVV